MLSSLILERPTKIVGYNFEIGVVYRSKKGLHYLSTDKGALITFVHGVIVVCNKPRGRYTVIRTMSVKDLCIMWNISSRELDEMSKEFFAPQRNGVRRRLPDKMGTRREPVKQETENVLWAMHRTFRLSNGST
jgi:hypothetical protein